MKTQLICLAGFGIRLPAAAWLVPGFLLPLAYNPPPSLGQTFDALPVYAVVQSGAQPEQAAALANSLQIPAGAFTLIDGEMHFIHPTNFLAPPVLAVTDPAVQRTLLADTVNKVPGIAIRFEQPDFTALKNLVVPGSNTVVTSFSTALSASGLTPQSAVPVVTHTLLTAQYTNDSGTLLSVSNYLDTEVSYQMNLHNLPVIGPGAQVQAAFGPGGAVTRLHYATRQLAPGPLVSLISSTVASNRAAALFPGINARITAQLVYYAPPLSLTTVSNLIPFYLCGGTTTFTNPDTREISTVNLLRALIPATDDPRFVPAIGLAAIANSGGTQVVANASVTGGTPPYTYLWSGSGPDVSSNTGPRISYRPGIQVAPAEIAPDFKAPGELALSWVDPLGLYQMESAPNFDPASWSVLPIPVGGSNGVNVVSVNTGSTQPQFYRLRLNTQQVPTSETVGVAVMDQNGVLVHAKQSVNVQSLPYLPPVQFNGPLVGWGTEGPYDHDFLSGAVNSWRNAMRNNPIFGAERFNRGEFVADRLDFIDEPRGNDEIIVDSSDITFYAGHGNTDLITFTTVFSEPGTPTSWLFANQVRGSWGNHQQDWMALLACEVLRQFDGYGRLVFERWGQVFDGLHLMLGFSSLAYADGTTGPGGAGFPEIFVKGMGGTWYENIQQAWFDAAMTTGPYWGSNLGWTGDPAAFGPIAAGGVWDFGDYWWGKGPVGPRIRAKNIRGWFYMTQTQ